MVKTSTGPHMSEIITEKENQDNKGLIEVTIPER